MEEDRTFGVEMELTSALTREELASTINTAFRQANSLHVCYATSWTQNRDGSNRTNWIAKTDGSIRTDHPDFRHAIELVTPVLRGEAGLEQLRIACEAIAPFVKVNKSCGLHVHHGVKPTDNLGNILMAWVSCENVIYKCLPVSRRMGHYAQPISRHLRAATPPSATMENGRVEFRRWLDSRVSGRYWGMNLQSLWLRGTIEIRCAAATCEFSKISNWVRVTQRLLVKGAVTPDAFRRVTNADDLTNQLASHVDLPARTELVQRAVESVRHGQLHNLPRRNTGRGTAFYYLLNSPDAVPYNEANRHLREALNCTREQADGYISRALRVLAPQTGAVAVGARRRRWGGQLINIVPPGTTEVNHVNEEVNFPAVQLAGVTGEDDLNALIWLRRRYAKFEPLHRAAGL